MVDGIPDPSSAERSEGSVLELLSTVSQGLRVLVWSKAKS